MEYRFNILFHLSLSHPDANAAEDVFAIQPTSECRKFLQRHGLILKQVPDGMLIITESIHPPGEVLRPINAVTGFQFLVFLLQPDLLNQTVGWNGTMPQFIGRSRLLYLNNLDDTETIDGKPIVNGTMNLAQNGTHISQEDLASVSGQIHQFEVEAGGKEIRLAPLSPGGGSTLSRPIEAGSILANIAEKPTVASPFFKPLPKGAWNVKRVPLGALNQTLVADDSLVTQRAFGLIEIFKDASVDYETPIRYLIRFETVS